MSTAAPLQNLAAKTQPSSSSAHAGFLLQRKCACGSPTASLTGECAECSSKKRLQAKLTIGASNDPLEQEADRVADQVLAAPANPAVSGAPPHIQRFTGQPSAPAGMAAPASVDRVLAGSGRPLEPPLRQDMEQRFGHDFGCVRVHTDARAGDSARSINALAYTVGQNVVFAAGRYEPRSDAGKRLLAHELVHVAQQRGQHEIIQRKDAGNLPASSGEPIREMPPIALEINAGWIWFTHLDGRFLVRIQADWLAHNIYGMSLAETDRLFRERRWPNIPNPSLPADRFIGELESRTGLSLLPAARTELTARGRIPLEKYGDFFYAAFIGEADLVRWFGSEQWRKYLSGESGLAAPGATDEDTLAAHPMETNRAVLADDAELARVYLVLMEHFTGLSVTQEEIEEMVSGGLSADELKQIIGDNAERGVLTDLFTQAWSEYRSAGGKDVYSFLHLAERILEQYQRGNITARANLLRIGKGGWPESDVLGIIHRNNNTLLYDAMGIPMRGTSGIALRDAGFIGFDPPAAVKRAAEALRERGLAPKVGVGEALTINQFGQVFGGHDAAMVAQAADATVCNIEEVGRRVKKGLAAEVLSVLGETAAFLAAFMLGHAFARLLIRTGNAISIFAGGALEVALRGAGYIMGLSFLAQTWEILLLAASHMSRVRNDASGRPTKLSELHMEQAARPIQQLIANAAAIMGPRAFGALIKRVKAKRARAEWGDPKAPLREVPDTAATGGKGDASKGKKSGGKGGIDPRTDTEVEQAFDSGAATSKAAGKTSGTTAPKQHPTAQDVSINIDEILPVGDKSASIAERRRRALSLDNREFKDAPTNQKTKWVRIDERDIERLKTVREPVSLRMQETVSGKTTSKMGDEFQTLWDRRFSEIHEVKVIGDRIVSDMKGKTTRPPGELKAELNSRLWDEFRNPKSAEGKIVAEAIERSGFGLVKAPNGDKVLRALSEGELRERGLEWVEGQGWIRSNISP